LAISFAVPSFAQQQKSLKELIVGTWLLESVYDQTQDGVKHNTWGDGVKGQVMFDAQGHYSWMIMSANRQKADTSPRIPVGQAIAYWGTYTVDDQAKTLTVTLERCTFPQWMEEKVRTILNFLQRTSSTSPLRNLFQIQRWGLSRHTLFSNVLQCRKYSIDPEIQGQLQAVSDALRFPFRKPRHPDGP